MAQAFVDKCLHKLSEYTSVKITPEGQVQFIVTPKIQEMEKSVVTLSGPAWVAFSYNGRNAVNECIKEEREEKWMYHPNTKFVKVLQSYRGWQVLMQTFTKKGNLMRDHTISLDEDEWNELDSKINDINKQFLEICEKRGRKSTGFIPVYQYKYPEQWGIKCPVKYYSKAACMADAYEIAKEYGGECGRAEITTEILPPLDPLEFMKKLYYALIYMVGMKANKWSCPACPGGKSVENSTHDHIMGVGLDGKKLVPKFWPIISQILSDDIVIDVFSKCWKVLKQPFIPALPMLKSIHTLLKDPKIIFSEVEYIMINFNIIPDLVIMQDVCKEMDFGMLIESRLDENEAKLSVDKENTHKKFKVDYADSDASSEESDYDPAKPISNLL